MFVDSFVNDTKLSASEAPRFWDMLPSSDKAKFQRKLKELKEKYIKDYKKFLKVSELLIIFIIPSANLTVYVTANDRIPENPDICRRKLGLA